MESFLERYSELSSKNFIKSTGQDIVMLIGNTGVGKTTILNMLNGSNLIAEKIPKTIGVRIRAEP